MKNKLFKTMTYAMLVTTGVGFIAPLAQPLSVFAEEKTEVKSESMIRNTETSRSISSAQKVLSTLMLVTLIIVI